MTSSPPALCVIRHITQRSPSPSSPPSLGRSFDHPTSLHATLHGGPPAAHRLPHSPASLSTASQGHTPSTPLGPPIPSRAHTPTQSPPLHTSQLLANCLPPYRIMSVLFNIRIRIFLYIFSTELTDPPPTPTPAPTVRPALGLVHASKIGKTHR